MQPKPIRVGAWELHHHVLKPTRCLLQTHAVRLHAALQRPLDFVTFVCSSHPPTPHPPPDDAAAGRVIVHRVLLDAAGAPLRSLVSGPFKEASSNTITVHERFDSFEVVRKFLHCEPIHMDEVPPELPLVADRWGLTTLFRACFTHAEERSRPHSETPRIHVAELLTRFLPIMAIVDVPTRFKTYMAMRMALEMRELNAYFRENPVHIPPLCRDAVCSLRHTDGVHCRRKKSVVLSDEIIPATHVANPSAQPVPDTLDSHKSKLSSDNSPKEANPKTTLVHDDDDVNHSEHPHDAEEQKLNSAVVDAPIQSTSAPDDSSRDTLSGTPPNKKPTLDKQLAAEEAQQKDGGQTTARQEQPACQAAQNGHLEEGDTAELRAQDSSASTPNDAESESRQVESRQPASLLDSGPEAQKKHAADLPVLKDEYDNEMVSKSDLPTRQESSSSSSTDGKGTDRSPAREHAPSASEKTVVQEQVNRKEAPAVEQTPLGVAELTSVHTETAQPVVTSALSSKEPIEERTGGKQGNRTEATATCEPSSSRDGQTTSKDESAEEPSLTLAAAESDQGRTTQTSQEPNSAEVEEDPPLDAPVEGTVESRQTVEGDNADREGDKLADGEPGEGHTGPCGDSNAQHDAETDAEQPAEQTGDGEASGTALDPEVDAQQDANGEVGGDAAADEANETTADAHDNANADANANAGSDAGSNVGSNVGSNAGSNTGSDADDHSNADAESDVADSASLAASEEPELPVYELDPSESEPKDWHKTFDVWNVFHQRNMLGDVIHFMSNYGCDNYIPLLLDVVLKQLEPTLSDDEILRFLRKCDWVWEAPAFSVLSELGKEWEPRAWRLLACARTGYYGEGKEYQMFWNYTQLAGDIRHRAVEVANKGSDSDSETSHSSTPDEGFMATWGRKVVDDEFEFTMSLNISDVGEPWDDLSPLYLKIRLIEKEDSAISQENTKRKVTARVNVIESGCGCVLGGEAPKVGTTASSSGGTLIRSVIDGFRFMNGSPSGAGGYSYSVMNGQVLKSWLEKHTRYCGLAFHVRLYVAPCSEDGSDTSSESSEEGIECTCGYCECAGCDRESEAEKESVYSENENDNDGGSDNENDS